MRNTLVGLTVAGFAIIGLAGCGGSSQATTGSAQWKAACSAIFLTTVPFGGGTDTTALVGYYDAIAADAQRIDAARAAQDSQGALTATTQFNVDVANSNLSSCP